MEDRELVAAIAAGDPTGLVAAYDKYAASLYGYCRWMLRDPTQAAHALREVFNVAAIHLGSLRDATWVRSWLYRVARNRCDQRLRATVAGLGAAFGGDPAVKGKTAPDQAEAQRLILQALARLKPGEREVIELGFRHRLNLDELAAVLGLSWSRAHALTSQARVHLERSLGTVLTARTGQRHCQALAGLLVTWDGQLTPRVREMVMQHVIYCGICSGCERGALRPEALADLLPLPSLPPELREFVLRRPHPARETITNSVPMAAEESTAPPEDPAQTEQSAQPEDLGSARPRRLRRAAELLTWNGIRRNPGTVLATAAAVIWVVAALTTTLTTVADMHTGRAPTVQARQTTVTPSTPVINSNSRARLGTGTARASLPEPLARISTIAALAPTVEPPSITAVAPGLSATPTVSASASSSARPTPRISSTSTPTPTFTTPPPIRSRP
ncbi:MAG: RNA polymerase sigma factor [Streptosporangiaceae bacterium]